MIITAKPRKRRASTGPKKLMDYYAHLKSIKVPFDFECARCHNPGWGEPIKTRAGGMHDDCAKVHEKEQRMQPVIS